MGHANPTLPNPGGGRRVTINGRAGPLSYSVAGDGPPLLLVHSINAAGSSYEMLPLIEAFRQDRRVYAVDLPGFGFSDRSKRRYDIALYVAAIADMVDEIAADSGGAAIDAAALSLSAEFLARFAREHPEAFRSICLITPTGFDRRAARRRGPAGTSREIPGLHAVFTGPGWGPGLYRLLVVRRSIRFFLEKTWGSKQIDEGALDYAYVTSHQPGAENAPFAFLSGRLFSADIRSVYEGLTMPVLVMHGTRGDFADFSGIGWTQERPNWRVVAFPTGALAHFERPAEVAACYRAFLADPAGQPSGAPFQPSSSSSSRSPNP